MQLKELFQMQKELDQYIVDKSIPGGCGEIPGDAECFLTDRILALSVEVGEFANATRCFKYWSIKPSEPKERLLDEYVDILHFWLSIGNTMKFTAEEIEQAYMKKNEENYKRQEQGY